MWQHDLARPFCHPTPASRSSASRTHTSLRVQGIALEKAQASTVDAGKNWMNRQTEDWRVWMLATRRKHPHIRATHHRITPNGEFASTQWQCAKCSSAAVQRRKTAAVDVWKAIRMIPGSFGCERCTASKNQRNDPGSSNWIPARAKDWSVVRSMSLEAWAAGQLLPSRGCEAHNPSSRIQIPRMGLFTKQYGTLKPSTRFPNEKDYGFAEPRVSWPPFLACPILELPKTRGIARFYASFKVRAGWLFFGVDSGGKRGVASEHGARPLFLFLFEVTDGLIVRVAGGNGFQYKGALICPWFSSDLLNCEGVTVLAIKSIPPLDFAWFNGTRSIVDHTDSAHRLPVWAPTFFCEIIVLRDAQEKWRESAPGGQLDWKRLISDEWLAGGIIDEMMRDIEARLSEDPALSSSTFVVSLAFQCYITKLALHGTTS
ncbi:hypothetical protein B0H14DRAFT_2648524 [Mycena olivaceomarginata]|nr:hypothetical protein B0H14DRAFT_2648524 [Mycena olivaceomarginata]